MFSKSSKLEYKQAQPVRFHPLLPTLHEDDGGVRLLHLPMVTQHAVKDVKEPLQIASWKVSSDFLLIEDSAEDKHIKEVATKGRELVDAIWRAWDIFNIDIFILQEAFFFNEKLDVRIKRLKEENIIRTVALSDLFAMRQSDLKENKEEIKVERGRFENPDHKKGWRWLQGPNGLLVLYNPKKVMLKKSGTDVFKIIQNAKTTVKPSYIEKCLSDSTQALEFQVDSSSFRLCNVNWEETEALNDVKQLLKIFLTKQDDVVAGDFGVSVVTPGKKYVVSNVDSPEFEEGVQSARFTEGFFRLESDGCIHQAVEINTFNPKQIEFKEFDSSTVPKLDDFVSYQKDELLRMTPFIDIAKEHEVNGGVDDLKQNQIIVKQYVNAFNEKEIEFHLGKTSFDKKTSQELKLFLMQNIASGGVGISGDEDESWAVKISKNNPSALIEVIDLLRVYIHNKIEQNNKVLQRALGLIDHQLGLLNYEVENTDLSNDKVYLKISNEIELITRLQDDVLRMINNGVQTPYFFQMFKFAVSELVRPVPVFGLSLFSSSSTSTVINLLEKLCELDAQLAIGIMVPKAPQDAKNIQSERKLNQ